MPPAGAVLSRAWRGEGMDSFVAADACRPRARHGCASTADPRVAGLICPPSRPAHRRTVQEPPDRASSLPQAELQPAAAAKGWYVVQESQCHLSSSSQQANNRKKKEGMPNCVLKHTL